jgi:flagellar operon protein (TIGR03826 family)
LCLNISKRIELLFKHFKNNRYIIVETTAGGIAMGELMNCPRCSGLFIKTNLRDVCEKCYKEEEQLFDMVYGYLRQKNNRTATIDQIVEDTGVSTQLIFKWVRIGRLKRSQFENIGYPCEQCGTIIGSGKLCAKCMNYFKQELEQEEKEALHRKQLQQHTYKFTQR